MEGFYFDDTSNHSMSEIVEKNKRNNLGKVIFERILYESTFYGVMFGGYLGWISIMHAFKNPETSDYAFLSIIAFI